MNDSVTETASTVAGQELRQFVERYERLEAEKVAAAQALAEEKAAEDAAAAAAEAAKAAEAAAAEENKDA